MNALSAVQDYIADGLKALRINYGAISGVSTLGPFSSSRNWLAYQTPGTDIDYASLVGDVWHNSAVRACLHALMRARTEAPPVVQQKDGEDWNNVDHDLETVLNTPNQQMSRTQFWCGMELSFDSFGTAYAKIVRDNLRRPRELYYLPHKWVMPFREAGSNDLVEYYRYTPPAMPHEVILPEDILQLQFGVNPDAPWFGLGFWDAALREIWVDHEAANFEGTSLKNGGSAWILSQKDAATESPTDAQIQRALDVLKSNTTRDKRGGYAWLDGNVSVQQASTNPDQMALELIRRIPETRICADAGLPTGWVGLMAGVERNTYNNSETDDRKAWNTICAYLAMQAEQITMQLLHTANYPQRGYSNQRASAGRSTQGGKELRVWFDTSAVTALQPNKPEVWTTAIQAYEAGVISLDECRADMNLPVMADMTPQERAELTTRQELRLNPPELIQANSAATDKSGNGSGAGRNGNQKVLI